MYVIKHLSAVEMTINLAAAALWYRVVNEVGSLYKAYENNIQVNDMLAYLSLIGMAAIFIGIIVFYCR